MFIARISKGRTIRQFVVFVIAVPSLVSFVWFSILGGAAFDLQLNEGKDMAALVDAGLESTLFDTLRSFPLSSVTVVLAVFLIAIFFVTGADSASIVMGMLSENGAEEPKRGLVVFWGVATGAIAAVLLFADGLSALQTGVIIVGFPVPHGAHRLVRLALKSLRAETFEATLRDPLRKVVVATKHHDDVRDGS
jgi:choline-glycine betaine transporter